MTKTKKFIILLILLAIGALSAFIVTKKSEVGENNAETVVSFAPEGVKSVSYTDGKGNLLTFSRKSAQDKWQYDDNPDFPLNGSYIDNMVLSLSKTESYKTIPQSEELSAYGIEENPFVITFFSGETLSFYFGSKSSLDGYRYYSLGDGVIHMTDETVNNRLDYDLMDMAITETVPQMPELIGLKVTLGEKSYSLVKKENSGLSYCDSHVWFYNSPADGFVTLDTELTDSFIRNISGIEWQGCVAYNAGSEALKAYGFTGDCLNATVFYRKESQTGESATDSAGLPFYLTGVDEGSFTVEFSRVDNAVYAHIPGSGYVYTVSNELYDNLVGVSLESLMPDGLIDVGWDEIEALEIEYLSPKTGERLAFSGNLADLEIETKKALQDWYSSVEYLTATGRGEKDTAEEESVFTLTVTRDRKDYSKVTLSLCPYDDYSYYVSLYAPKFPDDGSGYITGRTVGRETVDILLEELDGIVGNRLS